MPTVHEDEPRYYIDEDQLAAFEQAADCINLMRYVRKDQLAAFWRAVDGLDNPVAAKCLKFILFTGRRLKEATKLRRSEIDFAADMIRFAAGKYMFWEERFDLPMSSFVRDLLIVGDAGDWAFPGMYKHHIIGDCLRTIAKETGIEVSAHGLRQTFLMIAADIGIDDDVREALLNEGLDVTIEKLREAAQAICDRLVELCEVEKGFGPR